MKAKLLSNTFKHKDSLITAIDLNSRIMPEEEKKLFMSISRSYDSYTRDIENFERQKYINSELFITK